MAARVQNLTEGKILSGLIKLALPLMGTSFVQMAYTLMAMMWVGRLGARSEAAIGAIGMLLWLSSTLTILTMIGAEVSVGQSIGGKRLDRARKFASHATTIAALIGTTWTLILFFCGGEILSFFKLPKDITHEAFVFLRILAICLPFQFLSYTFAGIYNGAGRSSIPFKINITGLILNMILDPILMFVMGFGFYGAAIGSVISQLCVFAMFTFLLKTNRNILGKFPFFIRPDTKYLKRIFFLGTPVSVMNSIHAFINMNLARVASIYGGHIGMLTQTTGGQIEGVTWNTSQGFSTALSAYMAQNYAANKPERGKKAYLYAIRIMLMLGVFVSIMFVLFGHQIFGLIIPDQEAMKSGAQYLFVMGLVQIFMMLELTTQGMFNGVGRTIEPAIISIIFNALRIPLAYYLASRFGIIGVWWAIAISTVCKGIILPLWFMVIYNRMTKKKRNI
ncbi:MATE family efflux transporter [Dysgonomonas sp. 520]|uniref:MATE family efflux transporter n=1 Tax=Dysgonomonas sp. 520 TaxID=2302931 RepID=UPI0013D4474D|nr:MATE family efflux transporter [Dysgonomonas sp. 520]NDW09578.1 MATE family efflux transporter [Dysgonomonas sp. 520]